MEMAKQHIPIGISRSTTVKPTPDKNTYLYIRTNYNDLFGVPAQDTNFHHDLKISSSFISNNMNKIEDELVLS